MASPFPYDEAIAKGSELLNGILKRVLPEKMSESERVKLSQDLTIALLEKDSKEVLAQLAINEREAQSEKLFVSGWRPYVGWVCGNALAYTFILQPFVAFTVQLVAWSHAPEGTPFPTLPTLDMASLLAILGGLLGLGGLRTIEKSRGVAGGR